MTTELRNLVNCLILCLLKQQFNKAKPFSQQIVIKYAKSLAALLSFYASISEWC